MRETIRTISKKKKRSMKQEEIERAAVDSCVFERDIYNPESYYEQGFKDGANWRINSAWHSTSEEPEVGKHCLLEVESIEVDERYIDYVSSVWSMYGWTEDYLQLIDRRSEGQYKITRWAYVEDLLPNKEE